MLFFEKKEKRATKGSYSFDKKKKFQITLAVENFIGHEIKFQSFYGG